MPAASSRRVRFAAAIVCAACLASVAAAPSSGLSATVTMDVAQLEVTRLKPSAYRHRVFVFRLIGIAPASIRTAKLKPGGRRLKLKRIRKAAARGRLRVRRAEFQPMPPRRLGRKRLRRYRLVLGIHHFPATKSPQLFSPSSFWNAPLANDAPLDPSSATLSAQLRNMAQQQVIAGIGPWIETNSYTTPVYIVPADQPPVRVAVDDPGLPHHVNLQVAFEAVPIPPGARPATGTDHHLTVWQPSTDKLWELWNARRDAAGWHASFGGAMQNVSQSPGYYTRDSWPGAASWWGATATSLPAVGGTILLSELQRGRIDHALAMTIPAARTSQFSWPAQRTDGFGGPGAIPEGARFRLDPNLNVAALNLPPLVRMMAEAAQRYGMVVRDQTGGAIGLFVEDTSLLGSADPFWSGGLPRPDGFLQGIWPSPLMAKFPWSRVQLLKMTLCSSPNGGTCPWPR